MGWDILLFDLDGTLTDSGPGIMHAAKTALQSFGIDGLSEQERFRLMETEHVRKVVDRCHGNLSRAAELLGISRQTLYSKLKR